MNRPRTRVSGRSNAAAAAWSGPFLHDHGEWGVRGMKKSALMDSGVRDLADIEGGVPSRAECRRLLSRFAVPDGVGVHSEMVAELARILAVYLNRSGFSLRTDLIVSAGLLHDILRDASDGLDAGACLIRQLGFVRVAEVISSIVKESANDPPLPDEADLIFLADRCMEGDRVVPLHQQYRQVMDRFSAHPEIFNAACWQLNRAETIKRRVENILGRTMEEILQRHRRNLQAALSSGPRDLYLVCHGAVHEGNEGGRFLGQTDLPLARGGREQVEQLGRELSDVRFSAVFCSDLTQSSETAEIIAKPHCVSPGRMKELREVSLGRWEGLSRAEVARRWPGASAEWSGDLMQFRPPAGESLMDCTMRVIPAFYQILRENRGDVLVVGHEMVNRIILCQAMGISAERLFEFRQEHGCVNVIGVEDSAFTLKVLNRCSRRIEGLQ